MDHTNLRSAETWACKEETLPVDASAPAAARVRVPIVRVERPGIDSESVLSRATLPCPLHQPLKPGPAAALADPQLPHIDVTPKS